MTAIVTSSFRVVNAENFKQDVADANTSVYVGIGKSDVWSNAISDTTDTTPTTPVDALDTLGEAYQNMIGMKLIGTADISHVVPRYTWASDTSYHAWDSDDGSIFDKKFYIVHLNLRFTSVLKRVVLYLLFNQLKLLLILLQNQTVIFGSICTQFL